MVVSRIRVLQESFIETVPKTPGDLRLGSGMPLDIGVVYQPPPVWTIGDRPEGERTDYDDNDVMDKIYDRKVEDKTEALDVDSDVLPVLTLSSINLYPRTQEKATREVRKMAVTVVDDSLTVNQFAKAVRTLCLAASSSSSSTLPSSIHSVGLDCEWQPSIHPSDPLSLLANEDHPGDN